MKKYRLQLLITSIIIVLPIAFGVSVWSVLPQRIATHFDFNNNPNGWSSKEFAVYGLPLLMLGLHWFCAVAAIYDPKKRNMSDAMFRFVLWIVPSTTLILSFVVYGTALGLNVDTGRIVSVFVGLIFVCCGLIMPKNGQNHTAGIRLPWTLSSQENWNRTHRFASKVWVVGGVLFAANAFLMYNWLLVAIIGIMVVLPVVYSFVLYRKGI